MYGNIEIIAEVKTHSPFGYVARKSWDELFWLAEQVGDMVAVHTDPRWGGSLKLLQKARALTAKPLLAKGVHTSDAHIKEALMSGADWVLVVGRVPGVYRERCLIEPLTLRELQRLAPVTKAVWNSRDLLTGGLKKETFAQARHFFPGWLCQASNIRTVADIDVGANAILVGTYLAEFAQSLVRPSGERTRKSPPF